MCKVISHVLVEEGKYVWIAVGACPVGILAAEIYSGSSGPSFAWVAEAPPLEVIS